MLVRWNDRPTPRRAMRQAGAPATSRPSSKMRPALGFRAPANRLTSVVLPAPFGPMTACNSPCCREIETSRTAASPPKLRLKACVASTVLPRDASAMALDLGSLPLRRGGAAQPMAGPARQFDAAQAIGQRQHHDQNNQSFHQQLALG